MQAGSSITITPHHGNVRVHQKEVLIAETNRALALQEGDRPVIYYIPRDDVDMARLTVNEERSRCPNKGEATHYTIFVHGDLLENAAWSYDAPNPDVAQLLGYIAFDPGKIEKIEVEQGTAG